MVFKWHSPEILENSGLSKNDKFPRRATGQFTDSDRLRLRLRLHSPGDQYTKAALHDSGCLSFRFFHGQVLVEQDFQKLDVVHWRQWDVIKVFFS